MSDALDLDREGAVSVRSEPGPRRDGLGAAPAPMVTSTKPCVTLPLACTARSAPARGRRAASAAPRRRPAASSDRSGEQSANARRRQLAHPIGSSFAARPWRRNYGHAPGTSKTVHTRLIARRDRSRSAACACGRRGRGPAGDRAARSARRENLWRCTARRLMLDRMTRSTPHRSAKGTRHA
jgi:hypothetical protein